MTVIRWTFVVLPYGDGREVVHLHLSQPEQRQRDDWWAESPRRVIRAAREAMGLFSSILKGNGAEEAKADGDRLFKADEPIPPEAKTICWFDLKVDFGKKEPVYRTGEYGRTDFSAKYNPVWDCLVEVRGHLKEELAKRKKTTKGNKV